VWIMSDNLNDVWSCDAPDSHVSEFFNFFFFRKVSFLKIFVIYFLEYKN
jgi:hypothetical protein